MYSNSYSSGGSNGMETVTDPGGAFTIQMPSGWQNQANLRREQSVNQILATSTSPDRSAMIHMGDPRIPFFMEPGPMAQMMAFASPTPVHPYVPAEPFFQDYLRQNFGNAPGFRVADVQEDAMFQQLLMGEAMRNGQMVQGTAVCVVFGHQGMGQPMSCLLHGATLTNGSRWAAEVLVVSVTTPEYLEQVNDMALRMVSTRQISRLWLMNQDNLQMQQQIMGQMNSMFPGMGMPMPGQNPWMPGGQQFGQMNMPMPDMSQMGYGNMPPQYGMPQNGMQNPGMMPPQNSPQEWPPQNLMHPQYGPPQNAPQSQGWPQPPPQEMPPQPWGSGMPPQQIMPQNLQPQGWPQQNEMPPQYGTPQSSPLPQNWMQPNHSTPPPLWSPAQGLTAPNTMQESDARHRSWMQQQIKDDIAQKARVNMIRDEHTVADSSGTMYQVDREHARYYIHKRENIYIGADYNTELHDLYRLHGVNPDDYEEVKILG